LTYPQTSINATVGSVISQDTPTVGGTVTGYAVSPALPGGLSLNATTGTISGTPTALSAQATYTVTASNSTGSTTAVLKIAIGLAAPSNLVYPQTSITASVGTAISADVPTVSGIVAGYTVSPALPAGLTLDPTAGTISGTPTTVIAQATYTVTASNSAGSTTAALSITVVFTAPSNLVFSKPSVTATVGVSLDDESTVSGTVWSYSVSPLLPIGLELTQPQFGCFNCGGGIAGIPLGEYPQANYTITASNPGGSTTAVVSITVVLPAPSQLLYPQTTIYATPGISITPLTPSVSGTVKSYSSSPALPAGLTLDQTTGTISGTPTVAAPKTTYIISASNSGGSATAQITITVAAAPTVVLELGHGATVSAVQLASDRLLSLDVSGHWVLWGYSTATILASGDGATGLINNPNQGPLAGQFFAVSTATQIQLYAITDGHSLASIPFSVTQGQSWAQIASDGSYLCAGNASGLTVWSLDGQSELTVAGDYHAASPYAAPGQVQIANGPAGVNVIQTISVPSGGTSTGPQFSGTFNSWFLDGQSFFTNLSNNVWIYSAAGIQEAFLAMPSIANLTGNGNLFWQYAATNATEIDVYSVGSASKTQTYPVSSAQVDASGTTIAVIGTTQLSVINLSGQTPTETTQSWPGSIITYSVPVFGWLNSQAWVLAGQVIVDGASAAATPRYFGYGVPLGVAGSANVVAVATPLGMLLLNPSTDAQIGNIAGLVLAGSSEPVNMALSSDGSVLAAAQPVSAAPYADGTLNLYSIPSENLISTFPAGDLSFSLSPSGTMLLQQTAQGWDLTNLSGTIVLWSGGGAGPVAASPDGTLVAAASGVLPTEGGTVGGDSQIYQNGTLVAAVPAYALGWIDNNDLLAGNYVSAKYPGATYVTSTIYSPSGLTLITFPSNTLPEIVTPEFTGANSVYDPRSNAVYSLADGSNLWQGPALSPPNGATFGALAGPSVVYVHDHRVLLEPY
jgi:hypothetical protein